MWTRYQLIAQAKAAARTAAETTLSHQPRSRRSNRTAPVRHARTASTTGMGPEIRSILEMMDMARVS